MNHLEKFALLGAIALVLPAPVLASDPPAAAGPAAATATLRPSMAPFAWMDGQWRGEAWVLTRSGPVTVTQTERSGAMLGGDIRVVEGRGYGADGAATFNAFAVIAAKADGSFEMHSWAQGQAGTFPIKPTEDGFVWEIAAGPATIRYETHFRDGEWTEVGQRIVPGQPPMEILRMTLTRIGPGDWPSIGAVPPR